MSSIKLFITDIDGVWTDGGMYYDEQGSELKKFNTTDSAGVVFLQAIGIPVAIITGEDTELVRRRARKLKIEHVFSGIANKLEAAEGLCGKLGLSLQEVAYIGDDINDIRLLRAVGLSAAPSNAPDYVKKYVQWVLNVKGGDGAFRAFVEKYLTEQRLMDKIIEKYV